MELDKKKQLHFSISAASRLIIRKYQPDLDKLGILYTKYHVIMIFWKQMKLEASKIPVN